MLLDIAKAVLLDGSKNLKKVLSMNGTDRWRKVLKGSHELFSFLFAKFTRYMMKWIC